MQYPSYHSYGCFVQLYRAFFWILGALGSFSMMWGALQYLIQGNPVYFLLFAFGSVFVAFATTLIALLYPNLRVYEKGLEVDTFPFGWCWVPWRDVLEWHSGISTGSPASIILVRRLSLMHRFLGLLYAGSDHPGFLVRPAISDYTTLRQVVREHIKEEHGEP